MATWYLTNGRAAGSNHQALAAAAAAPTDAAAAPATGWVIGTVASANYALFAAKTERASGTFGGTAEPAGNPNNAVATGAGDCWRTPNRLWGTFSSGGSFTLTASVRNQTATGGVVRLRLRLWRSTDPTGGSPTEVTAGAVESASTSTLSATAQEVTCAHPLGADLTLTGEYLFFQLACRIMTAGGGATVDVDFQLGSTRSKVDTPTWTAADRGAGYAALVQETQPLNLLGYWRLGDASAGPMLDAQSGGDATVAVSGGVTFQAGSLVTADPTNGSVALAGAGTQRIVPNSGRSAYAYWGGGFSLVFLAQPLITSSPSNAEEGVVAQFANAGGSQADDVVRVTRNGGTPTSLDVHNRSGGGSFNIVTVVGVFAHDTRAHVGVTISGTGVVEVYLNGADVGGAGANAAMAPVHIDRGNPGIGSETGWDGTNTWYGRLDELAVWDAVLTAGEVAALSTESAAAAAQDTPELRGRPFGQRGQNQMRQLLAQ